MYIRLFRHGHTFYNSSHVWFRITTTETNFGSQVGSVTSSSKTITASYPSVYLHNIEIQNTRRGYGTQGGLRRDRRLLT
jgi:hypothetical protein